jgi:2-dehydro-3-deoxyphosphogluconate aldolase/(4S)-4-hydroxy-2-oxoglutarate aldolase
MSKDSNLQRMIDTGIVAVIRGKSSDELLDVIESIKAGGIDVIEVTMTTPGALKVIEEVKDKLGDEVLVGAGSVLDPETARAAMLAGAEFIVGPVINKDVISMCKRYSKIVIPGAFTPTEILTAWEAGADVVKVFPATKLGPGFFKDVLGPLPQVRLTPTGGVNLETASDFIKAGAVFLGVGSALLNKQAIAEKKWDVLTDLAQKYKKVIREARGL